MFSVWVIHILTSKKQNKFLNSCILWVLWGWFCIFVLLQFSKFILIFMPENALKTCFVYVNYNANMGKNLEIKCVTLMNIEVSVEVTKKIFYPYFVIRNLFWILRGRKMLVCTWISFITLEIRSLLLFPLGKQRSIDCSCQSLPYSPQFLQQWSRWSLLKSWVMVMCTKPHSTRTKWVLTVCLTLGAGCPAPNSVFMGLNWSWEEEGGGNTGKETS